MSARSRPRGTSAEVMPSAGQASYPRLSSAPKPQVWAEGPNRRDARQPYERGVVATGVREILAERVGLPARTITRLPSIRPTAPTNYSSHPDERRARSPSQTPSAG